MANKPTKKKSSSAPAPRVPVPMAYQFVTGNSGEDLATQVNALLGQGWIPQGGVMGFNYRPGDPSTPQPSQFFGQALVKYTP